MTFTKRSLFGKENLPCISSPATETFAKRATFSLVFARRKRSGVCAGNARRKRIRPAQGKDAYTPDCLWHFLPIPSLSKEGRYEIRPSSSFLFPFLKSLGAHTCANVRIPSSFLSRACRAASTYQHLEGVHRLRLIPMCLLKPSASFRRRILRAEVARCSHSLEEIRFSNPSLGTVVSCDVDILQFCCLFLCAPRRKGHCDNDRELLRRESTLQSSA